MTLWVNFTYPKYISLNYEQDELLVKFLLPEEFVSASSGEHLDTYSCSLYTYLPRQLAQNGQTDSIESMSNKFDFLMKFTFYLAIVMNIFLAKTEVLEYILIAINSLQLIIHIPLLNILLPSNVTMFFHILTPMVMFDVLDPVQRMGLDLKEVLFKYNQEMEQEYTDEAHY